jgi:NADP-dependent 3-hydroxy acid dehydrogenase YdfG
MPVSSVAKLRYANSYSVINRKNQKRVVTLSSDVTEGTSANEVVAKIQDVINGINIPEGYDVKMGGEQEQQEETSSFLGVAFGLAFALMFMIMVTQFNSAVKPLIIATTVLFSLIGVFLGNAIFHMKFSVVMTGVGFFALSGIVIRNGILLIEFIDELRQRGYEVNEAVIEGGATRMTPVILTAMSAILGLIPSCHRSQYRLRAAILAFQSAPVSRWRQRCFLGTTGMDDDLWIARCHIPYIARSAIYVYARVQYERMVPQKIYQKFYYTNYTRIVVVATKYEIERALRAPFFMTFNYSFRHSLMRITNKLPLILVKVQNRKMLVTIIGAGAGISHAVAELFGQKGFKIVLVARSEDKLKAQVEQLTTLGIDASCVIGDAGSESSLIKALDQIAEAHGPSDLVLYNAYYDNLKPLAAETWEGVKEQLDVNAGGVFHLLKHLLPQYKERNSGKIFITGGGLALQPMPRGLALGIGKAALRNMVQSVALDLRRTNIHLATLTVAGFVKPEDPKHNPKAIAEQYWRLYEQQPGEYETEVIY